MKCHGIAPCKDDPEDVKALYKEAENFEIARNSALVESEGIAVGLG